MWMGEGRRRMEKGDGWDNEHMSLGVYVSVPFCRTKCSYCNFASDVFSRAAFERYIDRICADMDHFPSTAADAGCELETKVDSMYLGGGTPTVLEFSQLERVFRALREKFRVEENAEITVECAPGTLSDAMLGCLLRCGVNRVSLGVQSLVDREAAAVGRLHKRETVLDDVARLRQAGISNINLDLIAGLPHQTAESWEYSVAETIASGVPHVSVYMLEVDEDSRLGRELIAGGTRYHAHFVPEDGAVAEFYTLACERLSASGIMQYEISNFARADFESRHNLKYWTRKPYVGFGVDAHSMLLSSRPGVDMVRLATPDSLEQYLAGSVRSLTQLSVEEALEESFFLGLRLTRGIDLREIAMKFGQQAVDDLSLTIAGLISDGLLEREADSIRLTARGRLFSNEVFQQFLQPRNRNSARRESAWLPSSSSPAERQLF